MPITVRLAGPADVPVVVEFNQRLAEESEGKTLDAALLTPGVAAALADERKAFYFVAEADGRVVGQMMITFEWSDWRNGWFWWIQSVYVRPEYRRRGVFRKLYETVHAIARASAEVIGLRILVERDNRVAQQTYERMDMAWTNYLALEKYPL